MCQTIHKSKRSKFFVSNMCNPQTIEVSSDPACVPVMCSHEGMYLHVRKQLAVATLTVCGGAALRGAR
jgi:hypothetical protein